MISIGFFRHRHFWGALALLLLHQAGYGQPNFSNPIVLNEENGLPSNYVTSAVPGPDGFI